MDEQQDNKGFWQPGSSGGQNKQASQDAASPSDETNANLGAAAIHSANGAPSAYAGYEMDQPVYEDQGGESITWQASEYIHHDKGMKWFSLFGVIVVAFAGLSVFLQAWTFLILIVVMAVALGIYAMRPPHILHYSLTPEGLTIGEKHYNFNDFRAFGVIDDGSTYSAMLVPVKRFLPALTVYFEEKDGEKIVDLLAAHLPMEKLEQDFVDKLMHRLHF